MVWYSWKIWRLAYAPLQDGEQHGHGWVWKPIGHGYYVAFMRYKDWQNAH